MRSAVQAGVFVFAVLALQLTSVAQYQTVPPSPGTVNGHETHSEMVSGENSLARFTPKRTGDTRMPAGAFNGYAQQRMVPDLGAPGSAGNGFSHFSLPMDKYTNWYRPRAATLTQYQRCAPDSFRPRGMGHLFNRPCDGYRMEYEPYSLSDGMSKYGPSYFVRMPDPRCPDCDHNADDCEECEKCRK